MLKLSLFNFELKVRMLQQKKYFDTGFGILHYARYIVMVFMLNFVQKLQTNRAVWLVGIYGMICYIIGWCWFKYEWILADVEVGNRFNLLARELRNYMKNKARKI